MSDEGVHEPLSLCAPVAIRWDLKVTKRIPLDSELLLGLQIRRHSVTESGTSNPVTHHK